jgi:uncharacterized Zn-finger protein
MKNHIMSVHEGKKQFKCEICNQGISSKKYMKTPIAFVHEGKKPFKCDICDATFNQKVGFMFPQFMEEKSHLNVAFVKSLLLKKET